MANETKAHIALMTGDLISRAGDPLDLCISLGSLRSDAGTYRMSGESRIYADAEAYTTIEGAKWGCDFFVINPSLCTSGFATLNIVGVDYQSRGKRYLVGAEPLIVPGATNVLLSHNPDVFPVAASRDST